VTKENNDHFWDQAYLHSLYSYRSLQIGGRQCKINVVEVPMMAFIV
jgi:hypothetical protein